MSSCRGRWTFALAGLFWSYACGDSPAATDSVAPSSGGAGAVDSSSIDSSHGDAGTRNGSGPGGEAAGGGATAGSSDPSPGATSDGIDTDLGLDPSAAPTTPGGSSTDAGAAAPEPTPGASDGPLTVYLAGDSI